MHYLPPLRLRRQLYWIRVMTGLTMALIVAVGVYLNWGSTIWPEPTVQNYDQVELRVSGLHCPIWCPVRVGTLLDPIPGVHEVLVDVTHARVTVRYDGDQLDPSALQRAFEQSEYRVYEAGAVEHIHPNPQGPVL